MKIRFFFFSRSDSGFTYGLPNERETPQISASKIKNQSSPKNRNPQEPQATDSTSEDVQHHDPNQTILQELHKPKKEKHRRNSYWFLETTDVRCRKEAALLRSLRQRERERERGPGRGRKTHKNTPRLARLATPSDSVSRRRVELDPAAPPRPARIPAAAGDRNSPRIPRSSRVSPDQSPPLSLSPVDTIRSTNFSPREARARTAGGEGSSP